MKRISVGILFCLLATSLAFAADEGGLLPRSFAGWTESGAPQTITDAAQADAAYPAVLKEYGFAGAETATYTRADGRKLTIKAARFNDATGAYGAFTFYRQPAMRTEQIGTKAASANERILFFRDNVLVDATFDRVTEMSAAELRELASMLPAAKGAAANLPSIPQYLPKSRCCGKLGQIHSRTTSSACRESPHSRRSRLISATTPRSCCRIIRRRAAHSRSR